MPEQTIECPKCGHRIPLTDALMRPIEENLRREYDAKSKEMIEQKVADELKKGKSKIEKEVEKKVKEEISFEMKDLRNQLDEKAKKLNEAEKKELELRKRKRELEESKAKLELEIERKMDKEHENIKNKMGEEHKLKIAEKEKQIMDMQKQIDELSRKAEQASQQLRGEVLELQLEEVLRTNFPSDEINPVAKGKKGADVFQKVLTSSGEYCGTILWEAKRAKWSNKWIPKLKDDQRRSKAEIGVLVSTTLPEKVSSFDVVEGVFVTDYQFVVPLATTLRNQLIEIVGIKRSIEGKVERKELLYRYLTTSPEFRQKIEMVVEAFIDLKKGLDGEKSAMERLWKKREKEIMRAVIGIAGMYGDMQGIVGASLPEIKGLELPALPTATSIGETKDTEEDV